MTHALWYICAMALYEEEMSDDEVFALVVSLVIGLVGAALFPVFQRHEHQAGILAAAREAEARHRDGARHARLGAEVGVHFGQHGLGAVARGARRQLDVGDDVALVLIRQEG